MAASLDSAALAVPGCRWLAAQYWSMWMWAATSVWLVATSDENFADASSTSGGDISVRADPKDFLAVGAGELLAVDFDVFLDFSKA